MKLKRSGLVALLCASMFAVQARADPAGAVGSCTGPSTNDGQAPLVSTPDYMAGGNADAAADAQADAVENAWTDHQIAVLDTLHLSPAPRDWALATIAGLGLRKATEASDQDRETLLKRAVNAAPDDVLVQWIAAIGLHSAVADRASVLRRLQQLEPGNAAVWLATLVAAKQRSDSAAIDKALNRMAASDRFDGHLADLSQALLQAYQKTPPPATVPVDGDLLRSARIAPYVYAASRATATALPAFQDLIAACRVDPATGANAQRSIDCAATGRLMAAHGDTVIANRIGWSLLRVSRTFSDEDIDKARTQDWLREQYTTAQLASAGAPDMASAEEVIAYETDWMQTGSEVEAMRRAVARAGSPLAPPDDWVDTLSPFSEQRLQQDQTASQHVAGTR